MFYIFDTIYLVCKIIGFSRLKTTDIYLFYFLKLIFSELYAHTFDATEGRAIPAFNIQYLKVSNIYFRFKSKLIYLIFRKDLQLHIETKRVKLFQVHFWPMNMNLRENLLLKFCVMSYRPNMSCGLSASKITSLESTQTFIFIGLFKNTRV